ncbi:N-acetylmuramoyl-L-alanine amidase [Staphylococcus chromogenes]|nr:N-acetylmuramoyl-L-alanine amidase [Staphylococcus chromogenes]
MSTALIASAAVGIGGSKVLHTQGEGIAPVSASIKTASFNDGSTVTVTDPAVRGQGGEGPKAVKEFTRDEEFSMFALTWQGKRDVVAHFRGQRADGTWTQWFTAEPASEVQSNGKNGTDPIYLEPTKKVQVSLLGVDMVPGTAAQQPQTSGLEAVFIDGKESAPAAGGVKLMADSDGMPRIISRAGWGADESIRQNCQPNPDYTDPINAITIHHTAGSNEYTEAQSAGIVRGIYTYHGQNLGWCDVGYHALVDKYGNIFEGRYGGVNKPIMGAHAGGFNENTWAISMMGDYSSVTPSRETIQSVGELAGWRAKVAGFDPTGTDTHYSEGTSYSKYPAGQAVTLPRIFAHRDVGTTTCPGDAGYAQMNNIRQIAKRKYDSIRSGSGPVSGGTTKPATGDTKPVSGNTGGTGTVGGTDVSGSKLTSLVDTINSLRNGDPAAIATVAGTVLGIVLTFLAKQGKLPSFITVDGGVPKIGGLSVTELPGKIQQAKALSSDPTLAKAGALLSSVLGKAEGNVQYAGKTAVQKHENGLVVSNPATGAHAVHGGIGDAWAAQGFDAGPLGLPTSEEYQQGALTRMDFQHGYITYDPATHQTKVHVK